MSAIEESIQVHAPLRVVYDQWTQFEEFPKFMEGIEEVRQIDDTHLHWVAAIGGQHHEWDAEISEQWRVFKELIETSDHTTDGWRGEVKRPEAA